MIHMTVKPRSFRFEITVALLIKIMLLILLWYVVFRVGGDRTQAQPDVAARFHLPAKTIQHE